MTRAPESVAAKWLEEHDSAVSFNIRAELCCGRAALLGAELARLLGDRLPPLPSDIDAIDWDTWEHPELPLTLPDGRKVVVWLGLDSYSEPVSWMVANIVDAPKLEAAQ